MMLTLLKKFFSPAAATPEQGQDAEYAAQLDNEITQLESLLKQNESDRQIQKDLMVKYNQALKAFAKDADYRHRVEEVFTKIDLLRNISRKSI